MALLIITAGLPAAGKSSYLKKANLNLPIVDPDAIKETHPEYDPKKPELLHDWSTMEARKLHFKYLSEGRDFIVDGTGTNVEKYAQYIKEAKELGYTVELHYVKVSLGTSIERNAKRERTVPKEIILAKAGVIDTTTKMIGAICDKFVTVVND